MGLTHGNPVLVLGFDMGHTNQGAPTQLGGSISSAVARSGTYSLLLAGTQRVYPLTSPDSGNQAVTTALSAGFAMYCTTVPTADTIVYAPCGGVDFLPQACITAAGKLAIGTSTAGAGSLTFHWTAASALSATTHYYVVLSVYYIGNSQHWPARLKYYNNSGTLIEDSGWVSAIGGAGLTQTNSVTFFGTASNDIYIGDVLGVTGGVDAPYVTAIAAIPAVNGVGGDDGWTVGAGPNKWDDVDEIPPNDGTDYITATASGTHQTFTHPATGLGAVNVLAIGLHTRAVRVGGAVATARPRLRINGVSVPVGTTISHTTSYLPSKSYQSRVITAVGPPYTYGNEYTVTGATDGVDNLELGISTITMVSSPTLRCTAVMGEVAHGPAWTDDYVRKPVPVLC